MLAQESATPFKRPHSTAFRQQHYDQAVMQQNRVRVDPESGSDCCVQD
jgi:hypothetical protein